MIYNVEVREVHVSTIEIEASSAALALQAVEKGSGKEIILEYSHTLNSSLWVVKERK